MTRRFMVLSAGMGAGHDAVAGELARRLGAQGHKVLVRDVLTLLPAGAGRALRSSYRFSVRHAPFLYAGVHALFLAPGEAGDGAPAGRPGRSGLLDVSPLPALAERRLGALVREWRPDAVVSTFHLAAQITGRMRGRGTLPVPSAVFVTDFALHRGWFHPDNDLYLCVTRSCAEAVRSATGARAAVSGPVVPPEFGRTPNTGAPGPPEVLLCAGAWGVGSGLIRTAQALAGHGCLPVLLCGRDERLRRRAGAVPGTVALGWVDDLPLRMASARLLVDNAAGQTAVQALAAGLPVVGYRPLAGHGTTGVRAMAAEGLTASAGSLGELLWHVDELLTPGPVREGQLARAAALFRDDAALFVTELAEA